MAHDRSALRHLPLGGLAGVLVLVRARSGVVARHLRSFWPIGSTVLLLALPSAASAASTPNYVRASFSAPVRRDEGQGRVNVGGTIVRLLALHANAYAFQIRKDSDWADLQRFVPAAQKRGLQVWVYLPAPCRPETDDPYAKDCTGPEPFHEDYLAWASAIARLSVRYPAVVSWAIDDFATHVTKPSECETTPSVCEKRTWVVFTPESMRRIRETAGRIQPRLEFYPVVYHDLLRSRYDGVDERNHSFLDTYADYFDALIMPFRDDPYRNNLVTDTLRFQLDDASALLRPKDLKPILMVYAYPLSSLGDSGVKVTVPPDVEYVRRLTTVGVHYSRAGVIAGVIQYLLPLTPGQPQKSDVGVHTGKGVAVAAVEGGTETSTGNWAGALTRIVLDSGSSSCRMMLWQTDNRAAPSQRGYHFKQVLLSDRTVWEGDVATDGTDWEAAGPFDVTPLLTHGPAQLILRLYEKGGVSNYRVRVRFDDVRLTGCHTTGDPGFEASGGAWAYIRRGGPAHAGSHTGPVIAGRHAPDLRYSTAVFRAVAALYAL